MTREALEAAKRASTAQLLIKCARLVNERALGRLAAKLGPQAPRAAHTALLPHIPYEGGIRLSELAAKVGNSKQAVGQLVDDLEASGFLKRMADDADARAKQICFTARGRAALLSGVAILREEEAELRKAIGGKRFDALHDTLLALHDVLTEGSPAGRPVGSPPTRGRRPVHSG
jgi:DNA-binding MarR family transcriptional regulator